MVALFWVFFVAACLQPNVSWHQKLVLIIQTPSGEVSGSAVVEVNGDMNQLPGSASEIVYKVRGEATVVEVLPGRYLFALLDGSDERFYWAARDRFPDQSRAEWLPQIPKQTEAVSLLTDQVPMLVTFDDITDPTTVREVDPDDLDAAFGCARESDALEFPWRDAGMTYRKWVESEVIRLSREMAAERSGVTRAAGDALDETHFIIDDHSYNAADELRLDELRLQFTEEQRRQWTKARRELLDELPAILPTPQTVTAASGGPCYQLNAVTLDITREAVTEGQIEGLPFWEQLKQQVTFSGLQMYDRKRPDEVNYLTYHSIKKDAL
jgi:hypothetical protein